ncbi:MAG: ribose-phosphate pyrophosphokinase [Eubacteriales bacterium]|nr:ribose-phosphate pyrophosphokinase [Eubacteriales bacterium]
MRYGNIKVFTGNANPALATEVANILGIPLGRCQVGRFSDGEISVNVQETVRGCDVFLIQSTCHPVNDSLMELLILIDSFKRASAGRITAVVPYYGYARQDRKSKARDPITAKLVANLITAAGADRVLTMDLHASQLQGFFDIPVDHLLGTPILLDYYRKNIPLEYLVAVAPDVGGVKRTRQFAEALSVPTAIIDKRRQKANESEVMNIIGDVAGKDCLLVDDMIDTAGTITQGAQALLGQGALSVQACCTHGVLSGPAIARLQASTLKEVVVLNTIPQHSAARLDNIRVLSVATLFAEAIERIYQDKAVSSLFTQTPQSVKPIHQLNFNDMMDREDEQ